MSCPSKQRVRVQWSVDPGVDSPHSPSSLMCSRASPGLLSWEFNLYVTITHAAFTPLTQSRPQFSRSVSYLSNADETDRSPMCAVVHFHSLMRRPFMVHHASCPALNPEEPTHHALRANSARGVSHRLGTHSQHKRRLGKRLASPRRTHSWRGSGCPSSSASRSSRRPPCG